MRQNVPAGQEPFGTSVPAVVGSIKLWVPGSGSRWRTISTGTEMALPVRWSPDRRSLAGIMDEPGNGEEQGRTAIWDVATDLGEKSDFLHSVAWHPDGERLATTCVNSREHKVDKIHNTELLGS